MPDSPSKYHTLFRGTLNLSIVLVGLASGIAQLAGIPTRIAQWALTAVFLASLLYFVVRVWHLGFVVKIRELRGDLLEAAKSLTLQQAGHQHYLDAIQRISDREKPLFSETLEVLVTVGSDDDSDRIVEKRVTTPEPLVTHRTMRPIVSTDTDRLARLDEISFKTVRLVTFSFPEGDQPPSVKERQGYGRISEPQRDPRGRWEVVWRDENPAGRRYVWDLTQPVGGN